MSFLTRLLPKSTTPTILKTTTKIDNEITVSTSPNHLFHSYVADQSDLKLTGSGNLLVKLPKHSNIKKMNGELNKLMKTWNGFKVAAYYKNTHRTTWVDRFNRYIATKIESPHSISFILRSDAVTELSNRGKFLIQCESANCEILVPTEINVNLADFSILQRSKR